MLAKKVETRPIVKNPESQKELEHRNIRLHTGNEGQRNFRVSREEGKRDRDRERERERNDRK